MHPGHEAFQAWLRRVFSVTQAQVCDKHVQPHFGGRKLSLARNQLRPDRVRDRRNHRCLNNDPIGEKQSLLKRDQKRFFPPLDSCDRFVIRKCLEKKGRKAYHEHERTAFTHSRISASVRVWSLCLARWKMRSTTPSVAAMPWRSSQNRIFDLPLMGPTSMI